MKEKYRNAFFLFGLAVLAIMVWQLDFREAWRHIREAGYWFIAVVVLWAWLYVHNTFSWYIIIHNGWPRKAEVGFWWLYRITISSAISGSGSSPSHSTSPSNPSMC